jgi:hypothetical protein
LLRVVKTRLAQKKMARLFPLQSGSSAPRLRTFTGHFLIFARHFSTVENLAAVATNGILVFLVLPIFLNLIKQ